MSKNLRTEVKNLTRILVQASVEHGVIRYVWGSYSPIRFQDWLAMIELAILSYPWDVERRRSGSVTSVCVGQRNKRYDNPESGRHRNVLYSVYIHVLSKKQSFDEVVIFRALRKSQSRSCNAQHPQSSREALAREAFAIFGGVVYLVWRVGVVLKFVLADLKFSLATSNDTLVRFEAWDTPVS